MCLFENVAVSETAFRMVVQKLTQYKVFVTDALCSALLATQKRLFGDVEAIELALTDFKARLPSPMPLGARKKEKRDYANQGEPKRLRHLFRNTHESILVK